MTKAEMELLMDLNSLENTAGNIVEVVLAFPLEKVIGVVHNIKSNPIMKNMDKDHISVIDKQLVIFEDLLKVQKNMNKFRNDLIEEMEKKQQVEFLKKVEPATEKWN